LRNHYQWKAYAALGAVCLFWGTTYLGIRIALETFSPVQLVAIRYFISGSLMLVVAKFLKVHLPSGRELLFTALFGVLILGIGNGCLAFAEELIPSGLAAIFITTSPFWMVGFEALLGGVALHGPTVAGMMVGLLGTVLLVGPSAIQNGLGGPVLIGFFLLQFGSAGWSLGSILQRRHPTLAHPVISGAVQQLATGIVYSIWALFAPAKAIHWTPRGVGAVLYLVVFGSIVGYSAYLYALEHLPVSVVSIYSYVNPVVAVFLGWLVFRESFGVREILAMCVIFVGVALVKKFSAARTIVQAATAADRYTRA
jgi:drug/metabolite transporter (DMT)-like permease